MARRRRWVQSDRTLTRAHLPTGSRDEASTQKDDDSLTRRFTGPWHGQFRQRTAKPPPLYFRWPIRDRHLAGRGVKTLRKITPHWRVGRVRGQAPAGVEAGNRACDHQFGLPSMRRGPLGSTRGDLLTSDHDFGRDGGRGKPPPLGMEGLVVVRDAHVEAKTTEAGARRQGLGPDRELQRPGPIRPEEDG